MTLKEGGYRQHGGNIGFNKKIFTATTFHLPHKNGISFKCTSPHLEEGFSGELHLQVIYTLDDEDEWSVEYKASSNRTTLVNFTQHTYFNLSGNPVNNIDEHELEILSHHYLPVNNMQVLTGEITSVINTPLDFKQFKAIGKDISVDGEQLKLSHGYDHNFVLEKQHTGNLKHAAVVKEDSSGRKMDVYTTEPSVHLYSGNSFRRRSPSCLLPFTTALS